ncbi:MAG TPA: hypothetical protein VNZ22_07575 [Bacillota bacterium]|nr:hypothetical protein [Bacillota bacterium]
MKKLKVIVPLIAVTGLFAMGQVQSQTNNNESAPPMDHHGGHRMGPEEHLNKLSEELNLTDQQKSQVQGVFDQMRQQVQAAVQEAKTNADTQLQEILTPEQYQKFQSLWQQHQHRWGHGGGSTDGNTGQ